MWYKLNISEFESCVFILHLEARVPFIVVDHQDYAHVLGAGEEISPRVTPQGTMVGDLYIFPIPHILNLQGLTNATNSSFKMIHQYCFILLQQVPIVDEPVLTVR